MSTTDILHYAWNKDAEGLKAAVSSYMEPLVNDKISGALQDVAASLFGATNGDVEPPLEITEPEVTQTTDVGDPNEDVQTTDS